MAPSPVSVQSHSIQATSPASWHSQRVSPEARNGVPLRFVVFVLAWRTSCTALAKAVAGQVTLNAAAAPARGRAGGRRLYPKAGVDVPDETAMISTPKLGALEAATSPRRSGSAAGETEDLVQGIEEEGHGRPLSR